MGWSWNVTLTTYTRPTECRHLKEYNYPASQYIRNIRTITPLMVGTYAPPVLRGRNYRCSRSDNEAILWSCWC